MLTFVSCVLLVLALLLAIPVAVLFVEVVAAIALRPRERLPIPMEEGARRRIAVLVPAHNEGAALLPTIADIKAQLGANDRLLVVADNCTDDTAAVAAAAGAEVVARNDPERIGKGYALDWGLRHLSADPPDVVVIVDADCRLSDRAIDRLAICSAQTGRPAQALDLMTAPERSPINHQVAEFAWRVKNWVRPLGLGNFGLPCQLMGTGMAFPWDVLRSAELASGQIVEDLKLGLDLAGQGRAALFCPSAVVTSEFPLSAAGADAQRKRWEHGHIRAIVSALPRYLGRAIAGRNLSLLALSLDLAVPPLALLGLLVSGAVVITGVAALLGVPSIAFIIATTTFAVFALSGFLSWYTYGRDILPASQLASIGRYVFGKLGLYVSLLTRGFVTRWTRTDRKNP